MRFSPIALALLFSSLTLASPNPNLRSENTNTIIKRTPLMARPMQSKAALLARSPQDNDDDNDGNNEDLVCSSEEKRCGNACIDEDWDCCPSDVSGGCPSDEECKQDDDGDWACEKDGNVFNRIGDKAGDIGDDIEDGWNDLTGNDDDDDDAAGMLRPGVGVALAAAVVAAVLPL